MRLDDADRALEQARLFYAVATDAGSSANDRRAAAREAVNLLDQVMRDMQEIRGELVFTSMGSDESFRWLLDADATADAEHADHMTGRHLFGRADGPPAGEPTPPSRWRRLVEPGPLTDPALTREPGQETAAMMREIRARRLAALDEDAGEPTVEIKVGAGHGC